MSNLKKVENLKGEFVKRKANSKKIYEVMGYSRENKAYQLDDVEDISRAIYVKKGTLLTIADY